MNKHLDNCSAAICNQDTNPNYKDEVLWYPGEQVCRNKPYEKFQLKQIKINELVRNSKFNKVDLGFTANELECLKIAQKPKNRVVEH